jgi:hypothetical protein
MVGVLMAAEMAAVLYGRWSGLARPPRDAAAGSYSNTKELRPAHLHRLRARLRGRRVCCWWRSSLRSP